MVFTLKLMTLCCNY